MLDYRLAFDDPYYLALLGLVPVVSSLVDDMSDLFKRYFVVAEEDVQVGEGTGGEDVGEPEPATAFREDTPGPGHNPLEGPPLALR